MWKFLERHKGTLHEHCFREKLFHGSLPARGLTYSSPWPVQKKKSQVLPWRQPVRCLFLLGMQVSAATALFTGLGAGMWETQSEVSIRRFKGREFVWSLCYLEALKLYNAKQVPFFFMYGSYISPLYYCHTFFQPDSWKHWKFTASKNFHLPLSEIIISELKEKIHIHLYAKISIFIVSPWTHTPCWIWTRGFENHTWSEGGALKNRSLKCSLLPINY